MSISLVRDQTRNTIFDRSRPSPSGLYNFLSGKKIKIKNLPEGVGYSPTEPAPAAPLYNEDAIYGVSTIPGEESSEDEAYGTGDEDEDDSVSAGGSGSDAEDDGDDDDLGSGFDDSDLEEARRAAGIESKGGEGGGGLGRGVSHSLR